MKTKYFVFVGSLCMVVMLLLASCGDDNGSPTLPMVLVQQIVTVPGGGDSANVSFSARSGQTIRITLTAANSSMVPYGFLESQPGTGVYQPPQETALNGQNSVELTLTQTGTYTLTVFDGSNQGGTVSVTIERLS